MSAERKPKKTKIIALRHGQSVWNAENKFTGWKDVPLSDKGRKEAEAAGELVARSGVDFSKAVLLTSTLQRAQETASYIAEKIHKAGRIRLIPQAYKLLNERNYGDWNGLNKAEVKALYNELFSSVRRGYKARPDGGESLEDVHLDRIIPFFKETLQKLIDDPDVETIIIAAHGNSLRALDIELGACTPEKVDKVEFETGVPIVYELEDGKLLNRYELGKESPPALTMDLSPFI